MHYAIVDVDVGLALPSVPLGPWQEGLGVLVRRQGRPISFSLHTLPPGALVSPDHLRRLIMDAGEADILAAAIGDEICPPQAALSAVDLTVVIRSRGTKQSLERCVGALRALQSAGERFDTLVVQRNPRTAATGGPIVGMNNVRATVAPGHGLASARNHALSTARTEWVAFLDDDVEVDHGWLAGLRSAVTEHDDAAVVTGLALPSELISKAQIQFERGERHRRGFDRRRLQGPRLPGDALYPFDTSDLVTSCNMAYRRHAALALGGFDEALDSGSPLQHATDMDMALRVLRSGRPLVYEPRMLVFRGHPVTRGALRHDYWGTGSGLGVYLAKTYSTRASERHALRGVARAFSRRHLRELRRSLDGRASVPPDLTVAELAGGFSALAKRKAVRNVRRSGS